MSLNSSVVLALIVAACAALPAEAAQVSVTGPANATPGGTVTVAVTLSPDLNDVYAFQGGLTYDPAVLTPLPAADGVPQGFHPGTAGNVFPGETIPKDADLFRMNASQAGLVVFGYVKNPGDPPASPSATVPALALQFTFDVAAGATGQTAIGLGSYNLNGAAMPAVILGARDGASIAAGVAPPLLVSLGGTGRMPGDANGDATVDLADVALQLQAAGGLASAPGVIVDNADVWPSGARDGAVTLQDAARTWRFLNGLDSGLN